MAKSRIEKATSAIVRAAEQASEDNDLNYQELVRAVTFALVSLNEKQLRYTESKNQKAEDNC